MYMFIDRISINLSRNEMLIEDGIWYAGIDGDRNYRMIFLNKEDHYSQLQPLFDDLPIPLRVEPDSDLYKQINLLLETIQSL